jgi:FtsP/CotA-like multicopper oxidase with cupredoxin domain
VIARRDFLRTAAAAALGAALPAHGQTLRGLRAAPATVSLVGAAHPATDVWAYERAVPGPQLRFRQGERLRIEVENGLPQETTVHWHGIRLPNNMDGVGGVTQPPIKSGERFTYEFTLPDAGTYWYHPHFASPGQVGRGLYGPLIVDEPEPIGVDRDVTWVLGDWRLDRSARIVEDFGTFMDASHAGRVGNTVTVNGAIREAFDVSAGERIRLRLINAANARIFGLDFRGHQPVVIALDGHPVAPHRPENARVVLGPSMRADILLDASGEPGSTHSVIDDFYQRRAYRLLDLRYAKARVRGRAGAQMPKLAPNPLAEPDVEKAERHRVRFEGGMMGRMPMGGMRHGMAWMVNGRPIGEHDHGEPLFTLAHGRSHLIEMVNDTAWHHPIHLHGHVFRLLTLNGKASAHRPWLDTVLLDPQARAEIAFVADNPGDWMFHCHVLEHQVSGLMALIRVA